MVIEIPKNTLDFFEGDDLRARIFYEKYTLRDANGKKIETLPTEMWRRLSRELASVEKDGERKKWEDNFYWLLEDFKFVPGGRILFGAGESRKSTLLNCYYLPIKSDSIESIYDAAKEMARTYSYGGGVGIDISVLRPKGAHVNNSAQFSTGAVSFMEIYSLTTGTIGQTGRRGALMITLDVRHPDIEDFVTVKSDKSKVRFANISVKIYDDFMEAVESGSDFELKFDNDKVHVSRKINARELWTKILDTALNTGDPGIIFWDRVKRESPTEYDDRMSVKGTNPCLAGDVFLQTQYGLTKMEKLQAKTSFKAADSEGVTDVSRVWLTGVKDVYRFSTPLGNYLDATENHKVMARTGPDIDPTEKRILDSVRSVRSIAGLNDLSKKTRLSSTTLISKLRILEKKGLVVTSKKQGRKAVFTATPQAYKINEFRWTELGDLKLGDKLLMSIKEGVFPADYLKLPSFNQLTDVNGHRRKLFKFPEVLDENVAGLIGWVLTDGTATHRKRKKSRLLDDERAIRIISINDDEDKDINSLVKNSLGVAPKGGRLRKNAPVKDWIVSGQNLAEFIDYFGLDKRHNRIEVPAQILASPKEVVSSFIKRVFEGDGACVYDCVTLDSTSYDFIRVMQQLLFKFGILSSIRTTARKAPRNDIHVLMINDLKSLNRFRDSIGFVSYSKNVAVTRLIFRLKSKLGTGNTQFSSKHRWIDGTHVETSISSKNYLGKKEVFDCTTSSHSFIANGFVVHNCAEQPLEDYGACDLGAINLDKFVSDSFSNKAKVDWENLDKVIRYAVRFLDNVLDYNYPRHPLKQQAEETVYARRIGLGIMGLANMLISMGIKYDTEEAIKFVDATFKRIKETAYDESVNIAGEKGSFPAFKKDKHLERDFVKRLSDGLKDRISKTGLRNSCILTIAPTGSISTMVGVSGGVEPIYAISYIRRSESLSAEKFEVFDPFVKRCMEKLKIKDKSTLPDTFVVAHKIDPFFRVKMQATIQRHIDSSISSTVNLSRSADVQMVNKIYMQAWKLGCKSITIYREGSKEDILIATDEKHEERQTKMVEEERPYILSGTTIKIPTPQGNLYITINKNDKDEIKEVFLSMGRSGETEKSYTEAIGRLISVYLQSGGNAMKIANTLRGIKGGNSSWFNGMQLLSVPDAIAKSIELVTKKRDLNAPNATLHTTINEDSKIKTNTCPSCHQHTLIFENGCFVCKSCGYTKCE